MTDPCKNVPQLVWGDKGLLRPEAIELSKCYDWEIKAVK